MNKGWYYNLSNNDISLTKESDINWQDVRKGLGWGAAMGAIPFSTSFLSPAEKQENPQQLIKQVDTIQEIPKSSIQEKPQEKSQERITSKSSLASPKELENFIVPWEGGFKNKAYKDSLGIWTIGAGFNLERTDADSILKKIGANKEELISGEQVLTQEQMSSLFQINLKTAISDAKEWIPNLEEQPKEVQKICIDMSFNMGKETIMTFKNTAKFIINKDYKNAAIQMQKSRWFGQVGNRSKHHVSVLENLAQESKK